jgi:predicted nucleic acid-binding Zn ribbon protein
VPDDVPDDLAGVELARAVLDAARARRAGRGRRPRSGFEPGGSVPVADAGDPGAAQPAGVSGGVEPRSGPPGEAGSGQRANEPAATPRRRRPTGYSGADADPRDPQPFGAILDRLVKARGWQRPAAEATVFGAWERVVGAEVAGHSRPTKLDNGELTVEAESTAWATQLRLLAPSLLQQIAAAVGHNVVRKLHIHGPTAPVWARGPRRVRGRGPRDTYG